MTSCLISLLEMISLGTVYITQTTKLLITVYVYMFILWTMTSVLFWICLVSCARRDTWNIVLHGLVLVRVGFLAPGGTHGTLSFMVRVLARVGFLVPGGTHATEYFIVGTIVFVSFFWLCYHNCYYSLFTEFVEVS